MGSEASKERKRKERDEERNQKKAIEDELRKRYEEDRKRHDEDRERKKVFEDELLKRAEEDRKRINVIEDEQRKHKNEMDKLESKRKINDLEHEKKKENNRHKEAIVREIGNIYEKHFITCEKAGLSTNEAEEKFNIRLGGLMRKLELNLDELPK
uniref:vicilin-like seed storage protein At2g18540 n=1 Tax=Styela clava TaxID=7725 RepID=UPI001939A567|nr:vicilin-like seed storage protein At2g18540 [Styela clava]